MHILYAFNTCMTRVIGWILIVVFAAMVVIIFAQVVFRYALMLPLSWSEELARYLFIWATFLGAAIAFYRDTHIKVTFFVDMARNARLRACIMILADLCTLAFFGMYVRQGLGISAHILELGQSAASMEWLSIGVVYLAVPVGSFFMCTNVLFQMLEHAGTAWTGRDPRAAHGPAQISH